MRICQYEKVHKVLLKFVHCKFIFQVIKQKWKWLKGAQKQGPEQRKMACFNPEQELASIKQLTNTERPNYKDSICHLRLCCLKEFAAIKNPKIKQYDRWKKMLFFPDSLWKTYRVDICQNRLGEAILTYIHDICFLEY